MRWKSLARFIGRYGLGALVFWGVVVGLQQCRQEHRPFARVDPWFTGSPSGDEWELLPKAHVLPTTREMSPVCAERLRERSHLPITYELANTLTGVEVAVLPGFLPVLVRSVQLSRYHHAVIARQNAAGGLWVRTETVSRWALPMLQRPTVLLVRRAPVEVFVDAEVFDNRAR